MYLDYAGFAPVDGRVLGVMQPFLEGGVGNASAPHALGSEARSSLAGARVKVGRLVGGSSEGVVFCSGATEANNLAIRGVAARVSGGHVVTTAVEHVSVLHPCRELAKRGYSVTYVPVDADGLVDPAAIEAAIRSETFLVSVLAGNGEIGSVQPIREIGQVTRERGIALHVDGVHALGRVPLDVEECGIDLLSMSANDLYGPPGVGALWTRPGRALGPMMLGGGQEQGYRSGTENVPGIVGMGVAADLARTEGGADSARLAALRDRLLEALLERVRDVRITGPRGRRRLPHHASIVVPRVKADALLLELDARGIAASSGSACNALTGEPSHVLIAIGCTRDEAEGSLCFTCGRWTTESDIDAVIDVLPRAVERLRALSAR